MKRTKYIRPPKYIRFWSGKKWIILVFKRGGYSKYDERLESSYPFYQKLEGMDAINHLFFCAERRVTQLLIKRRKRTTNAYWGKINTGKFPKSQGKTVRKKKPNIYDSQD